HAGRGIHGLGRRHPAELGPRLDPGLDSHHLVDVAALVDVVGLVGGDGAHHGAALLALESFGHGALHLVGFLARLGFDYRSLHRVPLLALMGLHHVAHAVVAGVAILGFVNRPLHGVLLVADRRFVDRLEDRIAAFSLLG